MNFKKILLFALVAISVLACGKDEEPTPESGPHMTSFSPISGPVGTTVWITGQNFGSTKADNTVKIGNTTATITSATSTEIFISVPEGATTGKISVTVDGKTDTGGTFTVTEPQGTIFPVIESIYNSDGTDEISPKDIIVIYGSGFDTDGTYVITFSNNVQGTITEIGEEFIKVEVPEGAVSGDITLEYEGVMKTIGDLVIVPNPITYVVGYVSDGVNDAPKLWIDGVAEDIENASSANAVFVDGETVYVAGKSLDDKATVWIDGVPHYLTDGSSYAEANSIIVDNGSYYVAGSVGTVENISKAMVWKDGEVLYELTDGISPADANSSIISHNIVYTVGYEYDEINDRDIPRIWIGNEAFNLNGNSTTGGRAYDIAIGNDEIISVVGHHELENIDRAILWRYGVSGTFLGTSEVRNSYKYSIVLKNMDDYEYYIAGSEETENGTYQARVWGSNDEFLKPDNSDAEAFDVFLFGNDVFTVGYEDNIAKVWKNGETHIDLNDGNNNFGKATGIFVKQ